MSDNKIYSIANASIISITDVKDEMFANRILGDGIGFILNSDEVKAPVSGVITMLFPTRHAFGITMSNGIQLLCHIGIDTVNCNGKNFKSFFKQGDYVNCGETIIKVDRKKLQKEYDLTTVLIIIESNGFLIELQQSGNVKYCEEIGNITSQK